MKSGCRERRLRRPRAMAAPPSPRSRPIRVTPDSLKQPGEATPPLADAHPAEGTAPPCLAIGNGYRRPAAAGHFACCLRQEGARRAAGSESVPFTLCTQFFIQHRFCDCDQVPPARKGALRQVLTRSLRCASGCGFRACPCSLPPPGPFSRTVLDEKLGREQKKVTNAL